ncbi:MAG: hypothetical protein J6U71_03370 [Bacteroidales bacterium]|nr:hypothetical protein [Bacteroidales bacterium]
MMEYKIERIKVDCREFLSKYQKVEKFLPMCRRCRNFGKVYTCPPFGDEIYSVLKNYRSLELFVMRVDASQMIGYEQARSYFDKEMLNLERENGGSLAFFAGSCTICGKGNCSREKGEECRYKELSRLSLEAVGIDVTSALSDYFGVELEWASESEAPSTIHLLSALAVDKFVV